MFSAFVIGVAIAFLTSIPVGPVGLICISQSIARGRWSGMVVGLGASFVDIFFAIIAVYSLQGVAHFIKEYALVFHLTSFVVLVIAAIYFFRSKSQIAHTRRSSVSHWENFFVAIVLNATNPFAIFSFFALFAMAGLDHGVSGLVAISAVIGVFIGSALWWYILCTFSDRLESKMDDRTLNALNKGFGLLTLAFAIYVLGKTVIFLLR